MNRIGLFTLTLFVSLPALSVEVVVQNPLSYRVRTVSFGRLVNAREDLPETLRVNIPDRYVIRNAQGQLLLEQSLERWRSSSRGEIGQPLVYPGSVGDCAYEFANRVGCDMYPFQNSEGETRYIALRFMYRQGERTEARPEGTRQVTTTTADGEEVTLPVRSPQPTFVEVGQGRVAAIPNRYDLFQNRMPPPFISNDNGGGWMDGQGLIRTLNDMKESLERNMANDDYSPIVDCSKPTLLGSEGQWSTEECYICNCANEAGTKDDAGKLAVNRATLRRVVSRHFRASQAFGRGICGTVMFQTRSSGGRMGAAYSWTLRESLQTHDRLPETDAVKRLGSVEALRQCISTGITALEQGPGPFDHYYNPAAVQSTPDWARDRDYTPIGVHRFYNLYGMDNTYAEALADDIGRGPGATTEAAEGTDADR